MKMKRTFWAAIALCLTVISSTAFAAYPSKPIKILVGFSAGGSTDVMARKIAPYLEKYLPGNASVVVENVPGASGQIAITNVAHARPDGYTIGTYNLPGVMARTLDRKAHYNAKSFTYLANIVDDPDVIVTPKSSGIKTIKQLVAKAKSGKPVTVGVSSLGGDDQFTVIKLKNVAGGQYRLIPFSGSAPARSAVMGGHVDAGMLNLSEAVHFQKQLNILGVASKKPSPLAPNIPTFTSQGVDLVNSSLRGFVGPAGMPANVTNTLRTAFRKAYNDPQFQKAMQKASYPIDLAVGAKFKQLNQQQLDFARHVWQTSPWRKR